MTSKLLAGSKGKMRAGRRGQKKKKKRGALLKSTLAACRITVSEQEIRS